MNTIEYSTMDKSAWGDGIYRDRAYVTDQVLSLARQLAATKPQGGK